MCFASSYPVSVYYPYSCAVDHFTKRRSVLGMSNSYYTVTWSTSLKLLTLLSVGILLGIPVYMLQTYTELHSILLWSLVVLPLVILAGGPLFMIRGYELTGNQLSVIRLGWRNQLDLQSLESVTVDPNAMSRSWRLFGNGGMFCFAGQFRNKTLGRYRAFATNPADSVVLRWGDRTIVVTPSEPTRFRNQVDMLMRPSGEREN